MIRDIPRFFKTTLAKLPSLSEDMTIAQFLKAEGYSDYFLERHLLPMAGAIWSAAPGDMRDYPAKAFLQFFHNHGLLKITNRPLWRTVKGGSREYVSRLIRSGRFETRLRTPVAAIRRHADGVTIRAVNGEEQGYDDVVIAAHADQALSMLADASGEERLLLSCFRYSRNRAILHRDPGLMPKRRRLWSSWNYLSELPPYSATTSAVTYWMNKLQPLPVEAPLFVSLNPLDVPRMEKVLAEFDYAHPIFDPAAMAAQKELWKIQGARRTWFCGAYWGSGFHEDGVQAGLAAAEGLGGVRRPWSVQNESGRIHLEPPRPEIVPATEAAA
jgi:predicted NAD/FAD-binding protein